MITDNNQLSEIDRSILLTEVITLTPGVALYNKNATLLIIIIFYTHKKNPPIKSYQWV